MKYTKEEISFLKENYERYGGKYCCIKLKRNSEAVGATARRLGLYYKKDEIHDSLRPVSFEQFKNISKEIAYFLGYFWADGYIKNYKSKNGKITYWRICLEIVEKDASDILNIMNKIGRWSIQKRNRKITWQETWSFVTNNEPLYLFLEENDFALKSSEEPSKILSKIPNYLLIYFWRGYFDGDGACGLVGRGRYIEFSSTYKYKWSEVIKLCESLSINNYKIYNQISKKGHKSSIFKIYGKASEPLLKYLLKSTIGLKRKTININKTIKNKKNEHTRNKPKRRI